MGISLRNVHIELSEHHGDCSPGAKVIVKNFEGLADFHASLKLYKYNRPGLEHCYFDPSRLELTVTDPFSNRIIFTEDLPRNKT
jgi:hypothetical protein